MNSQVDNPNPIPRRLSRTNHQGETEVISEDKLASRQGPLVVLGEPGMGKSVLLKKLSQKNPNAVLVHASSFIRGPREWKSDNPNEILFIDGLDEVAALQEGDPLHNVLTALIDIGKPNFVLSCRAADWRYAFAKVQISSDYGRAPEVWTLEGFIKDDAINFLTNAAGDGVAAEHIVDQLRAIGLDGFYENPLTLELIAQVAKPNISIPFDNRADLYEKACDILRIDPQRDESELDTLSKDEALDTSGAAMATLIVTGQDAITTSNADGVLKNLLSTSEITDLPNTKKIRPVLKSRLFRASEEDSASFVPYHRTIAEFLAARWLSRVLVDDKVAAARFLQMITVEGAVPASLRGMFAWLAIYDQFSDTVIDADPYGLIRYGDPAKLSREKAIHLIGALKRLEQDNPYFLPRDWQNIPGGGLSQFKAYPELCQLILDRNTGLHLKSVLLMMLKGTDAANQLQPELHKLVMSDQPYIIRWEVSKVLLDSSTDIEYWKNTIVELRQQNTIDSDRLAVELLPKIGVDNFSTESVTDCILAECGLATDDPSNDQRVIGSLWPLRELIPVSNIPEILDLLVDGIKRYGEDERSHDDNRRGRSQIRSFGCRLIIRSLEHDLSDPVRILNWLKMFGDSYFYQDEARQIDEILYEDMDLRRKIQSISLFDDEKTEPFRIFWSPFFALRPTLDDVAYHLAEFNNTERFSERQKAGWIALVRASRLEEGIPDRILDLAMIAARTDPTLEDELDRLLHPENEEWHKQEERLAAERRKREQESERENLEYRQQLLENLMDFEAGELKWIVPAAKVYLCLFSDIDSNAKPTERVMQWIGEDLAESALRGFEAVLHRTDIPSSTDVVRSYANSRYWPFIHPVIAGLAERLRTDTGFESVSEDVMKAGFYGLQGESIQERTGVVSELHEALTSHFSQTGELIEVYRNWFEPHFMSGTSRFYGLHSFVYDEATADFSPRLSLQWLKSFDGISFENQRHLALCILNNLASLKSTELQSFKEISISHTYDDDVDHGLFWAGVVFYIDFDLFLASVDRNLVDHKNLLWEIREIGGGRYYNEKVSLPLSINQLRWLISENRRKWPMVPLPTGTTMGDKNPWDATQYISDCIGRLSANVEDEANLALADLIQETEDRYTNQLKSSQASQRRARIEKNFETPTLAQFRATIKNDRPKTPRDLQVILMASLEEVQAKIFGDSENSYTMFYKDNGEPRTENECRDRLITMLKDMPHDISISSEVRMPNNTRADLTIECGNLQVPVEAKGQWNRYLWTAIQDQLDSLYTVHHKAQRHGIYLVFWFGHDPSLKISVKRPPDGSPSPTTAEELRKKLMDQIALGRKDDIRVFVLDLSRDLNH